MLFYLIEIPPRGREPAIRHIWDPIGREFPLPSRRALMRMIEAGHSGVIFDGVSKAASFEVICYDPVLRGGVGGFAAYNAELVRNSIEHFLTTRARALRSKLEFQKGAAG